MRSPSSAIAWELRRRHRWGLIGLVFYLVLLAALRLSVLEPGHRVTFEEDWSFAAAVVVPLASGFTYLLAVFSFGLAGDLAARRSMYPARMFALPVTSAALAGWPMLYGTLAMAGLWLMTRLLGIWPSGVEVPILWPALFAAVFLAWTQALTWMSYGLPGLRVIVTVVWLSLIGTAILLALHFKAPERVMLSLLAPQIPLAYLLARHAIARARRGDPPDWREGTTHSRSLGALIRGRRDFFSSPVRAQVWFEWRRHGRALPVLLGILLPFELSLLFIFRDTPVVVLETLAVVLLTPPFMATFVAATVCASSPGDSRGLAPFVASRPLTNVLLIASKLRAATRSTLVSWLLVLVAAPLAVGLSGTSPVVVDGAREVGGILGAPRATGAAVLGVFVLMVATWKQLVQGLYIGMSGRAVLVRASVFVSLAILTVVVFVAPWLIRHRGALTALWDALPWILAALAGLRLAAAVWIARRLHDSRLLEDRTLVIGALCWSLAVFALYCLLAWIVPTVVFRGYLLMLIATLTIPLARLAAAPLALSWSRSR